MIHLVDNKDCCGCEGCVSVCPKHCIFMQEDAEGFLYPQVDEKICVDCHLCERVCPVLNPKDSVTPIDILAFKHPDENTRFLSSSGGAFTVLAMSILSKGGVVFGARFNKNKEVVHDYTESVNGLVDLRGSKYVQSRIGDVYRKVEEFLKNGRNVLFSGTPCQIAGLHRYLRKEYDLLLTVDFICDGVPSPKVWRMYLQELGQSFLNKERGTGLDISSVNFRDKTFGWQNYSLAVRYRIDNGRSSMYCREKYKDPFLKGFIQNLYLRPACHHCPAKNSSSGSDITLGDLWGVSKLFSEVNDDKGVSVVLLNTKKGLSFQSEFFSIGKVPCDFLKKVNAAWWHSTIMPDKRSLFFNCLSDTSLSLTEKIEKYSVISPMKRIRLFMGRFARKVGLLR